MEKNEIKPIRLRRENIEDMLNLAIGDFVITIDDDGQECRKVWTGKEWKNLYSFYTKTTEEELMKSLYVQMPNLESIDEISKFKNKIQEWVDVAHNKYWAMLNFDLRYFTIFKLSDWKFTSSEMNMDSIGFTKEEEQESLQSQFKPACIDMALNVWECLQNFADGVKDITDDPGGALKIVIEKNKEIYFLLLFPYDEGVVEF